ncbi:MAG TPA: M81 family metallopeptidase [Terriglobia bacterium]|nr:M81 family metallopeptidase [Terriglobia bacterium]
MGAPLASFAAPQSGRCTGPKRVAFGGIRIECSTYTPILTRMEDFAVSRGQALANMPFFSMLKKSPYPFQPTLLADAVPGGAVEAKTYQQLKSEFLDRVKALLPLDGLYLAMHGAMSVEGMQDGDGDWITSARELVGKDCLIAASFDLHGSLSHRIIDSLDMLSAYRTAPHIDREQTTQRACDMLVRCLDQHIRPTMVWSPIPVLMPGERSSTRYQPAKRLWAQLPAMNAHPGVLDASLLVGYVWADEPKCTASAVLSGTQPATLKKDALSLAQQYWDARKEFRFGVPTGPLDEVIEKAVSLQTHPVVISDSGDNPTAGGTDDRADVLAALLSRHVHNVVIAGICDKAATDACSRAGVGRTVPLSIGATLDPKASKPVHAHAKVRFLSHMDDPLGQQAVIETEGISVVLTERRRPFHHVHDFTSLGLDPAKFKIIVVKAGYLEPEINKIANPNLMALTEGAVDQDIIHLSNYHRIPSYPFQPNLKWKPFAVVSARSRQQT